MDKQVLVKISTFAKQKDVSTSAVYNWIKEGKVEMKVIDGVKFIVTNLEEV